MHRVVHCAYKCTICSFGRLTCVGISVLGVYIVDRPNVNFGGQLVIDSCLQLLSILQQIIQLPMIRKF